MSHTYKQTTGEWFLPDGTLLGTGYAGHGEGVNNHADEGIENVGPIPVGRYLIGQAITHPTAGPLTMPLTPLPGTDLHGRSGGFLVHGDTASRDHGASRGCIVQEHATRATIAVSPIRELEVVE